MNRCSFRTVVLYLKMTDAAILESFESLHKAVDEFLGMARGGGLGDLSRDEFVSVARDLEALRRSLQTADHAVIAEVQARELPAKDLTRNVAGWLSAVWRLTP